MICYLRRFRQHRRPVDNLTLQCRSLGRLLQQWLSHFCEAGSSPDSLRRYLEGLALKMRSTSPNEYSNLIREAL